jgi:hypothetical protein
MCALAADGGRGGGGGRRGGLLGVPEKIDTFLTKRIFLCGAYTKKYSFDTFLPSFPSSFLSEWRLL